MYIAVKGGEPAIEASLRLLEQRRSGSGAGAPLDVSQLRGQLGFLVDRVMAEASLHDPELAALAIRQAQGDVCEAVFLLRAFRTTLPRIGATLPMDTGRMRARRRVSAVFKDLPGGQVLGASFDYSQRLLDFGLLQPQDPAAAAAAAAAAADAMAAEATGADAPPSDAVLADALAPLAAEGLIESTAASNDDAEPPDITREPPTFPMPRAARLQMLARADEGWVLGLAYSTQRGYAHTHPFAGEIRLGAVMVELVPEELGFAVPLGELQVTECRMVNQFAGTAEHPPQFTRGYGLVLGEGERKAMAMSLVDRALRAAELGEQIDSPAQQQEYALSHGDSVEASGFVQHLKLPHYVTFESELEMLRSLHARWMSMFGQPAGGGTPPQDPEPADLARPLAAVARPRAAVHPGAAK